MNQEQNRAQAADGHELGAAFATHNSPSFGGDLGADFEAKNSVDPAHYDTRHHRIDRAAQRAQRRHKWYWLAAATLVALTFVLVHRFTATPDNTKSSTSGKSSGAPAQTAGGGRGQQGPAAITVGQSATGNINIYNDSLGTVTPVNTITIYSQVTGRVMNVYYKEGQMVHKGQPLVEIDPRPYQANLINAEGTLNRDQGVLAEAKIDLARYQAAFAKNAIARQQLEDQQQLVVQDQGTVTADQGTVDYDKVQLAYCHIVAPITGRVGLRLVDPGNTVFSGNGTTLVVITQLQPITVVFDVSEDSLPQIETQLRTRRALEVDAYDRSNDKKIDTGKLTSLDNQIDTTTGTLKFRASFPNPNSLLFPNQFVNARLLVKTLNNVVLVPSAAVQHNGTAAFLYVVKPNHTVAVQPITTLTSNENETAVQGVDTNTPLATSGFDRLENGAQIMTRGGPGNSPHTSQTGNQGPGSTQHTSQSNNQGHGSTSSGSTGGSTAP